MAKFKTDTERILEAVSNHGSTFGEFCGAYSDCPERGDRAAWGALFRKIEDEITAGHLDVEREDGRIEMLTLTDDGAAKLRELQQRAF